MKILTCVVCLSSVLLSTCVNINPANLSTKTTDLASLKGEDTNQNGIRDDMDEYIDKYYTGTLNQALKQTAKAMQQAILSRDAMAAQKAGVLISRAEDCTFAMAAPTYDAPRTAILLQQLGYLLTNTPARITAYDNYHRALLSTAIDTSSQGYKQPL